VCGMTRCVDGQRGGLANQVIKEGW
jgi:hypothetical protein